MPQDFKTMIESILRQRPELTAETVRDMIDEKKRKVGAGYLTDQGALYLVAADIGVSFDAAPQVQSSIKDVYVGAKDVNITARIMTVYPVHTFTKRDSNEQSSTRTLTLYDRESRIKVKLWDKHVMIPDELGLRPGDVVRISKGYAKAGLDGKPIINLGSYSALEHAQDDGSIPSIGSLELDVGQVSSPVDNAVVAGVINANPRISDFVNQRGEASRSLQLQISSEKDIVSDASSVTAAASSLRSLRAVIWNIDESKIPKVFRTGSRVRLIGVRIKQGNPQYGNGDLEIHGDEGTVLEFPGPFEDVEVMPLRIISVGSETGRGSFVCLAADRAGRSFTLTIDKSLVSPEQLDSGSLIECVPSRLFGSSIILGKDDAYIKVTEEDSSFPLLSKFEVKVKDIKVSAEQNPMIVEVIVLQLPETSEVGTKSGETVSVTSVLVGDDTGEIRLVGWRAQSPSLAKLAVGERIKLVGTTTGLGREGKPELTFRPYSSIMHLE
ncbi:MAG: hypothetical protein ABI361_06070 [Nitrososphaera sp.]